MKRELKKAGQLFKNAGEGLAKGFLKATAVFNIIFISAAAGFGGFAVLSVIDAHPIRAFIWALLITSSSSAYIALLVKERYSEEEEEEKPETEGISLPGQ